MPVDLIRAPEHSRERSLGWLAAAWLEHFCVHGPGDIQGRPLSVAAPDGIPLSDELTTLLVDSYALDREGRRLYDSVFFSRPKGADKSGQAARIALFEAFRVRGAPGTLLLDGDGRVVGPLQMGADVADDTLAAVAGDTAPVPAAGEVAA